MSTTKEFGFRSSVGGYHKGDVNTYITRLAKDIAKQNEEWEIERGQFQREIQHEREEARKNERLREELTCQYLDALSKIDTIMEHLSAEQQKNEELIAEKENNLQRMEKLADFDLTKEALARAKVSLSLEQKRVSILQKEKENLTARLATVETSLNNSKDTVTSKIRDNKILSAENDALKAQLEAMDMIISSSKEILATEKQRSEAWNAKTDSLYAQIASLEKELAKAKTSSTAAINDVKSHLGNARAALNQTKQSLASEQNKNAALVKEKTALETEISNLKKTLEELEALQKDIQTNLTAEQEKNAALTKANRASESALQTEKN